MKLLISIFTVIIALQCTTMQGQNVQNIDQWHTYVSNAGNIRMRFPAEFQEHISSDSDIITHKISTNFENANYLLIFSIPNDQNDKNKRDLQLATNAFCMEVGGKIKDQHEFEIDTYKGIETQISVNNAYTIYYRTLSIDKTLYQIIVTFSKNTDKEITNRFFNSFKHF